MEKRRSLISEPPDTIKRQFKGRSKLLDSAGLAWVSRVKSTTGVVENHHDSRGLPLVRAASALLPTPGRASRFSTEELINDTGSRNIHHQTRHGFQVCQIDARRAESIWRTQNESQFYDRPHRLIQQGRDGDRIGEP